MRLCVGDGGEQVWTQANPAVGAVQQRHNHCSVWIEHISAHGHRHAHDQRLGQRQLGHRKELFERNHGRDESSKVLWRAFACLGCWCNHRTSARRPSQPACTQVCRRPPPSLSFSSCFPFRVHHFPPFCTGTPLYFQPMACLPPTPTSSPA